MMSSSTVIANEMVIKSLAEEITKAQFDAKANIKIASMAGDESMTMYATVLKPATKINAHVHQQGMELYHILKGSGEIYTGKLNQNSEEVQWEPPKKVSEGAMFAIHPGTVHQLRNTSQTEDLVLVFVCPQSHLKEDRIITQDY